MLRLMLLLLLLLLLLRLRLRCLLGLLAWADRWPDPRPQDLVPAG